MSHPPGRAAMEEWVARRGVVTGPPGSGLPDSGLYSELPTAPAHGAATYYSDLRQPRGQRQVRVCAGTACFVASGGGGHLSQVERALGVRAGQCAEDGSVSVQEVRCLGLCYAGPSALDGDEPRCGNDLADQLAGWAVPRDPPVPAHGVGRSTVLRGVLGEPAWRVWPELLSSAMAAGTGGYGVAADYVRRQVAAAGLRGRGGAGFLVAHKWSAVRTAGGDGPHFVVANGDEGDPGSYVDRLLMERDPSRVLEGLALAGLACGATQGFVYVRSEYPRAYTRLRKAVADARVAGHLGRDIHGSTVDFDIEVVPGAGSYVAGEETSLLRSMMGLRGTVRPRPPYPSEYGLFGRPTAVNNVETLAAVPAILADGGAAYARLGRAPETGTLVVCLNERFVRPGAYEVELGTALRDIVQGLGGGLVGGRPLVALQVGGPLGGFLGPEQLDLPLLSSVLDGAGVALGHGSLVAVDDRVSGAALSGHLWRFAADESCGACTPCREGTRRGAADPDRVGADRDLLDLMAVASLCPFGRGIPRAVRSLRRVFGIEE